MRRSSFENAVYDRLYYHGPEPRVPINKLGIERWDLLERAEDLITQLRVAEGLPAKALKLTYAGFKAIHQYLFQDLYTWAGKERTYTTGRNPIASFAPPDQISAWMEAQFGSLKRENYLRGLTAEEFAEKAATFICEINAAHPFIDGNGRTQRLWLQILAAQAGYSFTIRPDDREAWNDAARIGFLKSSKPMADVILARLGPAL